MTEVVNVTASSDLVRTDTPTVSQTVNANFIQTLPRSDRNALSFLVFLPGVTTIGTAGGYRNNSTIAGLPNNQFNITIDGVSNSNLLQSGDGFFSLVTPRLDAVEEVTLTTASAGADASGQGAIQIRFVTRSGTNKFELSAYEFMQHAKFNSNTFFNRLNGLPIPAGDQPHVWRPHRRPDRPAGLRRPRPGVLLLQPGRSVQPRANSPRSRTFIRQSALDGDFTYGAVGAQTTVNVLALAAANGQVSAYDPQVKSILEMIRAAAATTGTISELVTSPNYAAYDYLVGTTTNGTRRRRTSRSTCRRSTASRGPTTGSATTTTRTR